jgi:hypothetical protein
LWEKVAAEQPDEGWSLHRARYPSPVTQTRDTLSHKGRGLE